MWVAGYLHLVLASGQCVVVTYVAPCQFPQMSVERKCLYKVLYNGVTVWIIAIPRPVCLVSDVIVLVVVRGCDAFMANASE